MQKMFMAAALSAALMASGARTQAQETLDTSAVPASFRPYVHLIGSAEVVAPASGPNWRSMDIKAFDEGRKKYQELEAMVLKVWPQVQILTVMLDTLRPTFLSGIAIKIFSSISVLSCSWVGILLVSSAASSSGPASPH